LATLDEVDLVDALQTRVDAVEKKAGVQVQFHVERVNLPQNMEKELYCIAMEALNNSLKHSGATQLSVALCHKGSGIELDISDNGKGFESFATSLGGMGLNSMAERAERLGGKLAVTSTPGNGTLVHLRIEEAR
jgi:signal transduction histidine kinase